MLGGRFGRGGATLLGLGGGLATEAGLVTTGGEGLLPGSVLTATGDVLSGTVGAVLSGSASRFFSVFFRRGGFSGISSVAASGSFWDAETGSTCFSGFTTADFIGSVDCFV